MCIRDRYPDRAGVRWWTKAWFNNREEGEASVEIEREQGHLIHTCRISGKQFTGKTKRIIQTDGMLQVRSPVSYTHLAFAIHSNGKTE